jgi:hypothetical protein
MSPMEVVVEGAGAKKSNKIFGNLNRGADFSFLVIGDPGEGDASQYSLISRYLELGSPR